MDKDKQKIGRVVIFARGNRLKLRFTYPKGKRNDISVAPDNVEGWASAVRIASLIDRDITLTGR